MRRWRQVGVCIGNSRQIRMTWRFPPPSSATLSCVIVFDIDWNCVCTMSEWTEENINFRNMEGWRLRRYWTAAFTRRQRTGHLQIIYSPMRYACQAWTRLKWTVYFTHSSCPVVGPFTHGLVCTVLHYTWNGRQTGGTNLIVLAIRVHTEILIISRSFNFESYCIQTAPTSYSPI